MTFDLKAYLNENQTLINTYLKKVFESFNPGRKLIMAMKHSLMAGGKRLRPILSIASAQACSKDFLYALPACCAIELIHTYSLIHDDLPAMDDDDLRRGLPTCHKQFSEATAILAGDGLLTHAFHILSTPEPVFTKYPDNHIRMKLISKISKAAGIQGMVEGQMLDMQSVESASNDYLGHLKHIHALKTGKMIIASVESGAISVGASPETVSRLAIYADKIGLAFQVVDDILNVEGDPEIMGKAAGSDALNDKMTFPGIIGLDASRKYAKTLVAEAIEVVDCLNEPATALKEIANYIINRDR